MKTVAVEITERRRSTIAVAEADRIAIERIRVCCDLRGATHIDGKGRLCRDEEIRAGGHSSWETKMIRTATPMDHAALLLIDQLSNVHRRIG